MRFWGNGFRVRDDPERGLVRLDDRLLLVCFVKGVLEYAETLFFERLQRRDEDFLLRGQIF